MIRLYSLRAFSWHWIDWRIQCTFGLFPLSITNLMRFYFEQVSVLLNKASKTGFLSPRIQQKPFQTASKMLQKASALFRAALIVSTGHVLLHWVIAIMLIHMPLQQQNLQACTKQAHHACHCKEQDTACRQHLPMLMTMSRG